MDDSPRQILDEEGRLRPGQSVPEGLDAEALRALYALMLRQRLLDDLMLTLQRQGRIGFYGPATGQEAAVFGGVLLRRVLKHFYRAEESIKAGEEAAERALADIAEAVAALSA